MIKCPNCKGELNFDVTSQKVKCTYCGSEFIPDKLDVDAKASILSTSNIELYGKTYSCTQCGASIMNFDETAVTFCNYCGSQAMIEEKMMIVNAPEYIIPFKITKEECIDIYKKKISKSLFAPDFLKDDVTIEKFRGIFIPYVIYDLVEDNRRDFEGRVYLYHLFGYDYFQNYKVTANINASYTGLSYDLLSIYYDKYSHAIPFNYKNAIEFNQNYLIGYYADTKDVNIETYDAESLLIASKDSSKYLRKYREFTNHNCSDLYALFDIKDRSIGMFPVYFLSFRDNNDKLYYAIINGDDGKIVADIPISIKKCVIGSLLLSIIIFFMINNYLFLTANSITLFSVFAGMVSFLTILTQINRLNKEKHHLDDKGVKAVNKNGKEIKKPNFFKYIYKDIIAIFLPIIILTLSPVDDTYYYAASIISLLFVLLSFKDIIDEHNDLISNEIPQLKERGGNK